MEGVKAITTLAPHQVFLFGSNASGFHGAGAAGLAMRGTAANTWRTDPAFLAAICAPVGHPDRVGRWAVFGVARGLQQGREGTSYAIQTIERPGWKRSTPLRDIEDQIVALFEWAEANPTREVLFTPIGAGLSGWTPAEMASTLARAIERHAKPANVVIPDDLYGDVDWRAT